MRLLFMLIAAVLLIGNVAHAQIGDLIWEEDFNDLENWIKVTGNGNWGWGNGELVDMMEMGARQDFRDLHDEHNGGNGASAQSTTPRTWPFGKRTSVM